uniref:Uncharacterized protein n=1 Tax=Lepeophtheirus salmonis TaxID=72036 RepID=A0A0K2VJ07_LEPSM
MFNVEECTRQLICLISITVDIAIRISSYKSTQIVTRKTCSYIAFSLN